MIYFVQAPSGLVKIGTTTRLSVRLSALRQDAGEHLELLAVTDGGWPEEQALHRQFAHLRHRGEWFRLGDDLRDFIGHDARPWDGVDEVELVRATIDTAHVVRRALNASAARRGVSVGQVITELVEAHLQADLAYVDATPPPAKRKKS